MSASPAAVGRRPVRCAVYTRKSTEEGLDQEYNSVDAQRDAGHAYIASQKSEGWIAIDDDYADPGYSGGNMERPGFKRLLADIERGRIDVVVVYKVDRLTRSMADFFRMIEVFDRHKVSFISVTQQFNTATSMGRLVLNMLMSFSQFERDVTGERIRDKLAASKKKGMWMGGMPPLGYDVKDHRLLVNPKEAALVRRIFKGFVELGSPTLLVKQLEAEGATSKAWTTQGGVVHTGQKINKALVYKLVRNRIFLGEMRHLDKWYPGEHKPIIEMELWDKAQAVIAINPGTRRNNARAKVPFLLKGLLFDADGRALQPWQTRKKSGRLYRYYISTRELKEYAGASGLPRLPAEQLEALVVDQLREILRTPSFLAQIARQAGTLDPTLDEANVTVAMLRFDKVWEELAPDEQRRVVRLLVEKIVVAADNLEIRLLNLGSAGLTRELQANETELECA